MLSLFVMFNCHPLLFFCEKKAVIFFSLLPNLYWVICPSLYIFEPACLILIQNTLKTYTCLKIGTETEMYMQTFTAELLTTAQMWKRPKLLPSVRQREN